MAIKSAPSSINKGYQFSILQELKKIKSHNFFKVAPELVEKMDALTQEISTHKFKSENPKLLDGKLFNELEIKQMIVDATSFNKWKDPEIETLISENLSSIKDLYNVDFSEQVIHKYRFFRNTQNKDTVFMIEVVALPGFFYVMLATNRVGYYLDNLVNQKEFMQQISVECS